MFLFIPNRSDHNHNKNPNPIPIGTRFGFLLFGADGVIGFNEKCGKTDNVIKLRMTLGASALCFFALK